MSSNGDSCRGDDTQSDSSGIKCSRSYIKSRNGILAIFEMVFDLLAFICVEAVAKCHGAFECAPPGCMHTYRFFAVVTFASLLFSGAIFVARAADVDRRVPIPEKYRKSAECLYLAVTIAFYFIADVFMIAYHGNRLGFQCAAVFGVVAMATYSIQLSMYLGEYRFSDLFPFCRCASQKSTDENHSDGKQIAWELPPSIVVDSVAGPDSPDRLGPVILKQRRGSIDSVPLPKEHRTESDRSTPASATSEDTDCDDSEKGFHTVELGGSAGQIRSRSELPT